MGPEFSREIPQAIQEKWNSESQNQGEHISDHGPVLLGFFNLNDGRKNLEKYWRRHEDFIKIRRFLLRVFHKAAGDAEIGKLPTHTLRHSYRSWLDAVGTPIAVQQKLMRA